MNKPTDEKERNLFKAFKQWFYGRYARKRDTLLATDPVRFGLSPGEKTIPFGVVIDFGEEYETITVSALLNCVARKFICNKNGSLTHSTLVYPYRKAKNIIEIAGRVITHMNVCGSLPIPETGFINFHILTNNGIYSVKADTKNMWVDHIVFIGLYDAVVQMREDIVHDSY